jgi:anaerobic selenocysteine-containing dehydrogenase
MRVEVEEGRIRRIEAHPDNRAAPDGVCLKGLSYVERVVSPDRILRPLRRDPRSGSFAAISWDDALDRIAGELDRLRGDPGPRSVLYYAASGTKGLLNRVGANFWRLYGGYTTTYGDLCWPAGLEATRLTLGANKHNAPWDLAHARLIILWGKNAAETNIHQMTHLEAARRAGARVLVIDPRRTETAERADLLIQPRPGTDGALALAVANLLLEADRVDHAFVERHVLGFEAFRRRVREFPPERAAGICEVPVASIRRLADWLGSIRPATIAAGYGMQRYTNSGQTMRAILALVVLTGNLGRPGAGWQFANLQSAVFDAVPDPIAFYPPERPDGVVRVSIATARLGRDMLETRDPKLHMAWVERGNPLTQNPETGTVLRAFRRLEFRVVVEQFLTDTAREADLVLPAKTMFEQSDVIGAYWHPYIQLRQKVVDPPGEVKPETEIYRLLAERLGLPTDDLPGSSDEAIEAWLEARLAPFPGLDLERLRRGPALAPGHEEVAFADGVFPTPSGRIELLSEEAAARWGVDPLPEFHENEESARGAGAERFPLYLMTPNTKNRIHSQFGNLRMIRAVGERPLGRLHPDDAAARGIADGDPVRIFNDRGSLEIEARLDRALRPGCVSVTNGWWSTEGGAVNVCSLGRETDLGHGAAFHDNLVQVEKSSA